MRFSIVTPSLNQGAYLEQALRSVLDQDGVEIEYLVIDGGSTDDTPALLERYSPQLAYWTSQPDHGQSHALNKGIARMTGDVFGWLNADDLYLPGALKRVGAIFEAQPEVGLVYGDCLIQDERSGTRSQWQGVRPAGLEAMLVQANGIPQPSAFVRRSVLARTGWLDESFHLAMDYDLWLRIYKYAAVQYVAVPLSVVRDHPATKTRRLASRFVFEHLRAVDRFYAGADVPASAQSFRSAAYARLYYACAEAAALHERHPLAALGWLARAIHHDPRLVRRIPRAAARVLEVRER